MRKIKLLCISFVAALSLMGIGFAAWQDDLTVFNTVSTGQLNIEFMKDSNGSASSIFSIDDARQDYVKLQPTEISDNNKKLSISAKDLYPGAMVLYNSKAQNVGTIPAAISEIKVDFPIDNTLLKQSLVIAGGYTLFDKTGKVKYDSQNEPMEGYFVGTLAELQRNLNSILKGLRMDSEDYILFGVPEKYADKVKQKVPSFNKDWANNTVIYFPNLNEDQNQLQKQTVLFDIKINFQQFNKNIP